MRLPAPKASTVLIASTVAEAGCWLLVEGHRATMNITVPQYLFGLRIPHDVSMGFVLLELFGIPVAAVMLVISGAMVLARRLRSPAAT